MNYLHGFVSGLAYLHNPVADVILVLGTVLGVFVGAVPGLGGIVLLVVLLPFLYNRSPIIGLALLLASHSAIYYAGSTTAILINTPGAPESAATCIDGHAMAQNGEVGRALGISAAATTFGGWFGALVMIGAIPVMLKLVNVFHPPELFLLAVLAIIVIGQLQSGSITKGLISGGFGFLVSFVGAAQSTGSLRYTFGNLGLYNGINLASAAIGLFAVSQMFLLFASNQRISSATSVNLSREMRRQVRVGIRDVVSRPWLTLRSAIVGVISGVIPGIGSTAANFLSYGQAVQSSKHPEKFGTGIPEGIIAPEASSISKEAGALIPTVALAIPNGPAMAVLLAALSILGLQAGPSLLTNHLPLVFWMVIVLAIASLLASAIGLGLAPQLARVTRVPGRTLVPFVICLALLGSFESTGLFAQVYVMVIFGGIGLVMRRYGYSLPAVIVGAVLGSTAENNLILTTNIFGWSFLTRPLSDVLIAVIIGVIVLSALSRGRQRRRARDSLLAAGGATMETATASQASAISVVTSPRRSVGELIFDICLVAGSAGYVAIGTTYPSPANLGPVIIGSAVLAAATVQLVFGFFPALRRFTVGTPERAVMSAAVSAVRQSISDSTAPSAPVAAGVGAAALASLGDTVSAAAGVVLEERRAGGAYTVEDSQQMLRAAAPVADVLGALAPEGAAGDGERAGAGERDGEPPMAWWQRLVRGQAALQAIGFVVAVVLTAIIGVVGFEIAIPVFIMAYLPTVRRWRLPTALLAAVVMFGVCYGMIAGLHITIPPGYSI